MSITISWNVGFSSIVSKFRTTSLDYSRILNRNLPDTIRVLAIRIDFPRDTLSTTTGDGSFDYGARENRKIDPPPHDSIYFQHQFQFVHNYFHKVSNGKVSIKADVYPIGLRNAYRAHQPIWYYHPNPSDTALTNRRITELWKEGWELAASDTTIQFIRNGTEIYDVFVIIHAGAGNEYDVGFDETPFDIPSGYITKHDLHYYLNISDPRGLSLRNGEFFMTEGPILPEMSSQKVGNQWIDIGVGGLYAFLIGRSIGLPFMYDVFNGQSRLGRWDFMDRGFGTFFGILPAYPSAYLRIKMGWSQYTIAPDTGYLSIRIPNADTIPLPEIYRINSSGTEYFLVEARNRDPDSLNYTYVYDASGHRAKLTNRYEIELDPSVVDSFGVITRVDNYEFDIPGSGILIWRINVEEEQYRNRNNYPYQSGSQPYVVTLIEADGANDIGQNYGFFHPGSGTETGSPHDAYYQNNPDWRYANNGDNAIRFTPYVIPPAVMSNGSPAPFELRNFSLPSRVMHFFIRKTYQHEGEIRLRIPPTSTKKISLPFDANNDQQDELWIIDSTRIYCLNDSGQWLGRQVDVHIHRDPFSKVLLDSILSYKVFQIPSGPIHFAIFGKDVNQASFLFLSSFDSSQKQTTIYSLKLNWNQDYFIVDSIYTLFLANRLISAFTNNLSSWIVFIENYEPLEITYRLELKNSLILTPSYYPIVRSNGTYRLFETKNIDQVLGIGTALGDFIYLNNQLSFSNGSQWILQTFFPSNESIIHFVNTSENVGIVSQNYWWLWGNNSIRQDFPKRLNITSIPTSAVSAISNLNEPVLWIGTRDGELYKLNVSTNDFRYPIGVGLRNVSSISILVDSSISQNEFRIAAVSDDGGIYLTTRPLVEVTAITSNCVYGSAFGKPLPIPPKDWSNQIQFSNGFQALIWPNPIRKEKAYLRVLTSNHLIYSTKVDIYDLEGEKIASLSEPYLVEGGGFEFEWNVQKINRGIYLIRIQCGSYPVQIVKAAVL
ncbi:MAG: hypothetical protein N2450_04265 [bacterium]|nr:hypothetical protein [bacterium]